jgi:hypothetical protein
MDADDYPRRAVERLVRQSLREGRVVLLADADPPGTTSCESFANLADALRALAAEDMAAACLDRIEEVEWRGAGRGRRLVLDMTPEGSTGTIRYELLFPAPKRREAT